MAIVSSKPQTTRNRITGIHTVGEDQYVFLDTPGMHKPRTKLGDFMVKTANETLGGVDAAILVVEAREEVGDIEAALISRIKADKLPAVLVINKTDTVRPVNIAKTIAAYAEAYDFDAVIPMCAKNGKGVDILLDECKKYLSESDFFFPSDALTDQPERQIAAEIIREKALRNLRDEIPHGIGVEVLAMENQGDERRAVTIHANIFCEKESHKGIIIGKKEYIDRMKKMDMDIAGEFITMAAELMLIKSKMLLPKPKDEADAAGMLQLLSGRDHQVMTGVTVLRGEKRRTVTEVTDIHFRPLSEKEIRSYVATGEPMDKAGAYGIQGGAALFCERMVGDYYNVMGLPVCRLGQVLKQIAPEIMEDTL